jgi:hypothetical protein
LKTVFILVKAIPLCLDAQFDEFLLIIYFLFYSENFINISAVYMAVLAAELELSGGPIIFV